MFKRNVIRIEWIGEEYDEFLDQDFEIWNINGLTYHARDLKAAIDCHTKFFSLWEKLTMKIEVA